MFTAALNIFSSAMHGVAGGQDESKRQNDSGLEETLKLTHVLLRFE
jgi:hypothetical protein